MYSVFLDDERNPENITWVVYPEDVKFFIVRTYQQFCEEIETCGLPEFISFDHDLADFQDGREYTGFDAVKWLVDYCMDHQVMFPKYEIHSMNPIGRERMINYIENAKEKVGI